MCGNISEKQPSIYSVLYSDGNQIHV